MYCRLENFSAYLTRPNQKPLCESDLPTRYIHFVREHTLLSLSCPSFSPWPRDDLPDGLWVTSARCPHLYTPGCVQEAPGDVVIFVRPCFCSPNLSWFGVPAFPGSGSGFPGSYTWAFLVNKAICSAFLLLDLFSSELIYRRRVQLVMLGW
jgi:hypothetical protein